MNASTTRYTLFETRWGHFGFICRDDLVCRTLLPVPDQATARQTLLANHLANGQEFPYEKNLHQGLQQRIVAYFEGENVDFSTDPTVDLTDLTVFQQTILAACRRIGFGQTLNYADLATHAGRPKAARAIGNAMARNPIPLIVPCHRVIRTDGGLGGFSAFGGTTTKQRLLQHERPT